MEIMITEKNKIYTLSHTPNFISLIVHYIQHFCNFIFIVIYGKDCEIFQLGGLLEEINKYYLKYNNSIDLDEVINIADMNDTIDQLELFNQHYNEKFGISIFSSEVLKQRQNNYLYFQKQLYRFLLGFSLSEIDSYKDYSALYIKLIATVVYNPSKRIYLNENQVFHEKICINNFPYFPRIQYIPSYSIFHKKTQFFIKMHIDKEYFILNYTNIVIFLKKDDYPFIYRIQFAVDKLGNIINDPENNNFDIPIDISARSTHDNCKINICLHNIDINILRYNIIVSNKNQFNHDDVFGLYINRLSITNTNQIFDPTRLCELHLLS
jgi:hypothetical protein